MFGANHDASLDLKHPVCQACIMNMTMSSVPSGNNTGYLCNHHLSYINGQHTSQGLLAYPQQVVAADGGFDLATNLAPLSIIGSESSSDSHHTVKAVRADLCQILGQDYHAVFDPNKLTENTMRAFDYSHAHACPPNIFGWVHHETSDEPMTDSMLAMAPAKKSTSSINTTSWCLVESPGEEQSYPTDKDVFATGAQYDNDAAYPCTMDEALDEAVMDQ